MTPRRSPSPSSRCRRRLFAFYFVNEVNDEFFFEGVGEVMGEVAVRLEVDAADVAAEGLVDFHGGGAGRAVAWVNYDFEGAVHFDGVYYVFDVVSLRGCRRVGLCRRGSRLFR